MQSFAGECDGLKNFLVCFFSVFNYGHVMTSISDMGVNFKFGASKKTREFRSTGVYYIAFLFRTFYCDFGRTEGIVRIPEDFVMRFVMSGFHFTYNSHRFGITNYK